MTGQTYCDLEPRGNAWICRRCWQIYRAQVIAVCRRGATRTGRTPAQIATDAVDSIRQRLEGIGNGEAFERLEHCETCDKFRGFFCGRDAGCDRVSVFLLRLVQGRCERFPADLRRDREPRQQTAEPEESEQSSQTYRQNPPTGTDFAADHGKTVDTPGGYPP